MVLATIERNSMTKKQRTSNIKRKTTETDIAGKLVIDGAGKAGVKTGIGFLDHMLTLFARHALMDLDLRCQGMEFATEMIIKASLNRARIEAGLVEWSKLFWYPHRRLRTIYPTSQFLAKNKIPRGRW
jgi:hypothetical protein